MNYLKEKTSRIKIFTVTKIFFKENDVSPSKSMEIGRCNKPALLKDPRST
jgi:hypothetical protein